MTPSELAAMLDHTVLKPDATAAHIRQLCDEARRYNFAAVCVAPMWVELAAGELRDTPVHVASVAGFPHGNTLSRVKADETARAVEAGAREVDMVIPIGALKAGDHDLVEADIRAVVAAARRTPNIIVKVILETCLLTDEEKVVACRLAEAAGADFVKTSTGFASGGATVADVALMKRTVGHRLRVKAAGGIRDLTTALAMIEAGAARIGCSASVAIVRELEEREGVTSHD